MDKIDREILTIVQRQGRITQRELGKLVALSPNAAGERLQRLVDQCVIAGFAAVVDHGVLGYPIEATIDVWLNHGGERGPLLDLIKDDDRVIECVHLTGPLDFRIRARVATTDDLNELLNRMRTDGGVRQTDSRLVLEQLPT